MGSRSTRFAARACDSDLSRDGIVASWISSLAGILWDVSSSVIQAVVALGSGRSAAANFDSFNADLSDHANLRAGTGDPGRWNRAIRAGHCRCDSPDVSECLAAIRPAALVHHDGRVSDSGI